MTELKPEAILLYKFLVGMAAGVFLGISGTLIVLVLSGVIRT